MSDPVMNILAIQERDIFVLFEMSHKDIKILRESLSRCQISVDKTIPEDVILEERFFAFYNQLEALEDQLKAQYGSPSNTK